MAPKMAVSIIYNLHITPIKCLSSYSKKAHNSMFSFLEDTFQLTDLFPKWSIFKGINWGSGDLARYKRNSVCNKTFIQNNSS